METPVKLGLTAGAVAPFRALPFLLGHPRLWGLAAAPFFINLAVFILFFWFSYSRFNAWVSGLVPTGEGWWWAALFYLLASLAVVMLLAVEVLLFTVVGRIIAAPFLELLTRAAERLALGGQVADADWAPSTVWRDMLRVLGQEAKKLALYLAAMALLLLVNLLPGLGLVIYPALSFLLTTFFLALEFLDYPLDRRGLSLARKIGYVRRLGVGWLGFGTAVFALGVVPVLNLALLPLAAVGGTLLYLKKPL